MSWISCLFLLAGLYLLTVLVRGIVQFISWCSEEYLVRPPEPRHREEKMPQQTPEPSPKTASSTRKIEGPHEVAGRAAASIPVKSVQQARRPSRVGRFLKLLRARVFTRSYEHWVESALSEDDLAIKIEYLSEALKLNPTYLPAWGMKGYAFLELERYEEAMECFDKCLEADPNALTRFKKGLCYYRMMRHEEAIACFRKALEECGEQNRPLLEDISRMKKLVEGELGSGEAPVAVAKSDDLHDSPRVLRDAHEESQQPSSNQANTSAPSDVLKDKNVILVM